MNKYHKAISLRIMGTNYPPCQKFRRNFNLYFEMLDMYDRMVQDSPHKCCYYFRYPNYL